MFVWEGGRLLRRILLGASTLVLLAGLAVIGIGRGCLGRHEEPGTVTERSLPAGVVADRARAQRAAAGTRAAKQILFGDLHVHTTFSFDAFLASLPIGSGEGAHPPADACDFARYCSALDFWSINDHAEGLSPRHWRETIDSIRQCNAVAGDAANPDVVAFLGWEWTQVGATPEDHYGHKNVVLAHTDEDRIPARPIASRGLASQVLAGLSVRQRATLAIIGREQRLFDFARFVQDRAEVPPCEEGVPAPELPANCHESTATPGELFRKLDEWGHESMVIPHGTTWGLYTPPGSTWDKQLSAAQHDSERQTLVEVFSGHGNSEEYRDWRGVRFDASGEPFCPEPSDNHIPACRRAGEIIRARCAAEGLAPDVCEARAVEARRHHAAAGAAGHHTVPGARPEEWLDAGQCRDCFLPAFNYRPGGSVQYMMALRKFDGGGDPARFRFGFIASSDNHTARPGTGYKEYDRREMTEAGGPDEEWSSLTAGTPSKPVAQSKPFDIDTTDLQGFQLVDVERGSSFFLTGGLVAAHAAGRDRASIWEALERREVYGTSGPRILLWFELLNPPDGEVESGEAALPMGSQVAMARNPVFEVRAVGSFQQQPGCPDYALGSLPSERLHHLCRGECYNPSDVRRLITRIEVVRIRPQRRPDEPVAALIEDPWRVLDCRPDPAGCSALFVDPDFAGSERDALYYVRAIEEPSPAVNARNLRCRTDADGSCVDVDICYGDYRVPYQEDCLAENEERAWSSPIFVDFAPSG